MPRARRGVGAPAPLPATRVARRRKIWRRGTIFLRTPRAARLPRAWETPRGPARGLGRSLCFPWAPAAAGLLSPRAPAPRGAAGPAACPRACVPVLSWCWAEPSKLCAARAEEVRFLLARDLTSFFSPFFIPRSFASPESSFSRNGTRAWAARAHTAGDTEGHVASYELVSCHRGRGGREVGAAVAAWTQHGGPRPVPAPAPAPLIIKWSLIRSPGRRIRGQPHWQPHWQAHWQAALAATQTRNRSHGRRRVAQPHVAMVPKRVPLGSPLSAQRPAPTTYVAAAGPAPCSRRCRQHHFTAPTASSDAGTGTASPTRHT